MCNDFNLYLRRLCKQVLKSQKNNAGSGQVDWSVKSLLHKFQDLSSSPTAHVKSQVWQHMLVLNKGDVRKLMNQWACDAQNQSTKEKAYLRKGGRKVENNNQSCCPSPCVSWYVNVCIHIKTAHTYTSHIDKNANHVLEKKKKNLLWNLLALYPTFLCCLSRFQNPLWFYVSGCLQVCIHFCCVSYLERGNWGLLAELKAWELMGWSAYISNCRNIHCLYQISHLSLNLCNR